MPPSAVAEEAVRIALLPVVVHSAENPGYLRQGLADMLASRFEQLGTFDVVQVEDPAKATTQLSDALAVGRSVEADFVLFGSFTRFGSGASLDMQAAATDPAGDGEILRQIFVHSGSIGDVIPDLDSVVGKVTRFAVSDFRAATPAAVSESGASGAASAATPELRDLERRIQALESAMEAVRGGAPSGE